MKNELIKPKHFKSKLAKVGICFAGLVGGVAGTFFLVPNKTKVIDLGMPQEEEAAPETYFSRFVSRFTANTEGEEEEVKSYPALSADFDGFEISWPGNTVAIDGNLKFKMKNLNDIALSLDLDADYNNKKCDVALALTNKTVYFALKDLRLKQSFSESGVEGVKDVFTVLDEVFEKFFDVDNEDGLRINLSTSELVGSLLGGVDFNSLLSGSGIGLDISETEKEETVEINLGLTISGDEETEKEPTKMNILVVLGKENLDLRKVDLGTLTFGDLTIKGVLNCVTSDGIEVLGLDDPNYPKQRGEFIEIINYSNWIDKIFNLLNTRQIGLDLSANLKSYSGSVATNICYADIAADLDASELFDLHDLDLMKVISGEQSIDSIYGPDGIEDGDNAITDLLNKFDFNVGIKLGNIIEGVKKEYSNIGVAYYTNEEGHNAGFLTFNEEDDDAVLRAKIDVQTVNYLIAKVPELIDLIEGKKSSSTKVSKTGESEEKGLFDFITSSELVTAIKDGHYEGILDVVETLKSTAKTIELVLNLSSLGFGDNAKISLVLDAGDEENMPTNVISIKAQNIRLNDFELDAEIKTRPYSDIELQKVDSNRDKYDTLDFVPGMFDQVYKIIDSEQAGIKLSGDILDSQNLGFDFSGWAQLDYSKKNGIGSIRFDEYKTTAGVIDNDHQIDISIDDISGDHANNNMLFEYSNPKLAGDSEPLRGKFTLKTFDDIFDLVTRLIEEQDRRFMKFFDDILAEIRNSLLMQIIESEDYLQLAQSSYIQSIKQSNDGNFLDIYISEKLIPLDLIKSPLHIQLEFGRDSYDQKNLKAVNIVELDLGEKKVNASIELCDYEEGLVNPVDVTKEFMNFSDIAVLLEFGINSIELNYYHLTGKVDLSALLVVNASVNLDFHIYVNGVTTKVYGKISNLPHVYDASCEFVFEPDHDASNNDIGGYFYILREEDHLLPWDDKQYFYVCDSKTFLDNILTYILGGCLGYGSLTSLGDLDLSSDEPVNPIYQNMFTDTGFNYSHSETKDVWNLGVDLGVVTGNSSFSALEATIEGTTVNGKGYFTKLTAETKIISILNVSAVINLVDPNPETSDWPSSVETRYEQIINYYKSMSESTKSSFYNKPNSSYSCKLGTI